jgi:CubicO group peptidase (beta-lactamase class C family)
MTDSLAESLPRTSSVIKSGRQRGLHSGFQIYVSLQGESVVDAACGESRPGRAMTTDTILPWLSAGKPLTAVAILQLFERNLIDLDTTVASFIPEFGAGGKELVTVRHLLTHTGGFRDVDSRWPFDSWTGVVSRICAAPVEGGWEIGQTAGYHPSSSWYILGELIERLDGRPWPLFLLEEICEPLNLTDTWNSIPESAWRATGDRIAPLSQRDRGKVMLLPWHDSAHCGQPSPGVSTRGPIRQLGRFYESLCGVSAGPALLSADSVALMTKRHRHGSFDKTLRHKVDFGLGVILNSNRYGAETVPYGFGRFSSDGTFGHGGSQSSIGFADPDHGLVVAWVANTRAGEGQHQKRNREINSAIYQDLGLAQKQDSK